MRLNYLYQIKYLMTIFLNALFSDLLLSNKGLESHDSPDLDDAASNNFCWRFFSFSCFCSLQAARNSAMANPMNPRMISPMPMNACHGRRYFCTSQSTMTDAGIANIVPTLCKNKYRVKALRQTRQWSWRPWTNQWNAVDWYKVVKIAKLGVCMQLNSAVACNSAIARIGYLKC